MSDIKIGTVIKSALQRGQKKDPKLVSILNRKARIALLTTGKTDTEQWERVISQYGSVALKHPKDVSCYPDITIIPDCNLTADMQFQSSPEDLAVSDWWLTRTMAEKIAPTIYTGRSGLIFAEARSSHTVIAFKNKGYTPLLSMYNTSGQADFFVSASGCYGVRRFCLPTNAEVLYYTPVQMLGTKGVETENLVSGFKIDNNIILLFNPHMIENKESSDFYQRTNILYGSETLMLGIYDQLIENI